MKEDVPNFVPKQEHLPDLLSKLGTLFLIKTTWQNTCSDFKT